MAAEESWPMSFDVVFSPNPIQERDPRLARQFEQVVLETLRAQEAALAAGTVQVRFHLWSGDDAVPRYVCKVECGGAPSLEMEDPPWRWWSGLVETPQELGQELREALRSSARRRGSADAHPPAPAPPERWGWAGDLQLV
jgi:hypothetical protein